MTKISIITVCYNSESTIRQTMETLSSQDHTDVEHIVVDGASSDQTTNIVREFPRAKLVSEPDNGLYDAMNKGVARATGNVVGILNSDDFYPDPGVLSRVAAVFDERRVDATIGDVAFVNPREVTEVIRYYSARTWHPGKFEWGLMPPHPAFFARRELFERLGDYNIKYRIAADYELLIRFLRVAGVSYQHIPGALVHMRPGGISNRDLASRLAVNREVLQACRENGLNTNIFKLCTKYVFKLLEAIRRNPYGTRAT